MKITPFAFLLSGFLLATILSGCKKDDDILPVSQYLKDMIQYKHGQIVRFVSTDNEEITAKLEVEESFEECTTCQPVEKRQVFEYILRNTANVDYPIVATLQIIDRAENEVFMTMFSPVSNFIAGRGFNFKTVDKTSEFFIDNKYYFFHKDITIGSTVYKNVLEINYEIDQVPEFEVSFLYYTKEKGIIKFGYKNGKSYILDN